MPARFILQLDRQAKVEDRGEGELLPVLVMLGKHSGWGNTWLAEVSAVDDDAPGGFIQEFLEPESQNLSREGNGVVMYSIDRDGIYQANSVWRSFLTHRIIIRVKDGTVQILGSTGVDGTIAKIRGVLYEAITGGPKPRAKRQPKTTVSTP